MSKTLGIILAAGRSTRLFPATLVATKQILPIYDKPLIYYPLTSLMLAGVRDFVIIVSPKEKPVFEELFYDHKNLMGVNVTVTVQEYPVGIPDAFRITLETLEEKVNEFDRFALILGDNIFYGAAMTGLIQDGIKQEEAVVFATPVKDPERFGVVEVNKLGKAISMEEKPKKPKSNLAVVGLYLYPSNVFHKAAKLRPSARGELEITDLNSEYMRDNNLVVKKMLRGMVWFDTGTPDSMMEASQFIQTVQNRQDILVGSPHEAAFINGWISEYELMTTANLCGKTFYGQYLLSLLEQ